MVGSQVLSLALTNAAIDKTVVYGRRACGCSDKKLVEILSNDFLEFPEELKSLLPSVDHILFCLGVYTGAVKREPFRKITVDMPVALANLHSKVNPQGKFSLLSGQGADRTESSRMMFATDKGAAENALNEMYGTSFYTFRPGYIYPVEKRKEPNFSYRISRKLYPLLKYLGPKFSITSHELGEGIFQSALVHPTTNILENQDILSFVNSTHR